MYTTAVQYTHVHKEFKSHTTQHDNFRDKKLITAKEHFRKFEWLDQQLHQHDKAVLTSETLTLNSGSMFRGPVALLHDRNSILGATDTARTILLSSSTHGWPCWSRGKRCVGQDNTKPWVHWPGRHAGRPPRQSQGATPAGTSDPTLGVGVCYHSAAAPDLHTQHKSPWNTRTHITLKHTHTSSWHTPSHLKTRPHMTQPTSVCFDYH